MFLCPVLGIPLRVLVDIVKAGSMDDLLNVCVGLRKSLLGVSLGDNFPSQNSLLLFFSLSNVYNCDSRASSLVVCPWLQVFSPCVALNKSRVIFTKRRLQIFLIKPVFSITVRRCFADAVSYNSTSKYFSQRRNVTPLIKILLPSLSRSLSWTRTAQLTVETATLLCQHLPN